MQKMRILLIAQSTRGDPRLLYHRFVDCVPDPHVRVLIHAYTQCARFDFALGGHPGSGSTLASYLNARYPIPEEDKQEIVAWAPDFGWKRCEPSLIDKETTPVYDTVIFARRITKHPENIAQDMRHFADFVSCTARGKTLPFPVVDVKEIARELQALHPELCAEICRELPPVRPNLTAERDTRYDVQSAPCEGHIQELAQLDDAAQRLILRVRGAMGVMPEKKKELFGSISYAISRMQDDMFRAMIGLGEDKRTRESEGSPVQPDEPAEEAAAATAAAADNHCPRPAAKKMRTLRDTRSSPLFAQHNKEEEEEDRRSS